jgi:hypothetical protein
MGVFSDLWNKYPAGTDGTAIRIEEGCAAFENQCAIRLSRALNEVTKREIFQKRYIEKLGPVCVSTNSSGVEINHARGAEEMAKHLVRYFGKPEKIKPASSARISGRKGIVFFKDISGFRRGRGDHIDLWDGNQTRTSRSDYSPSSKELWFWELK